MLQQNLLTGETDSLRGGTDGKNEPVTATLDLPSQTMTCWTCGSEVEQNVIDERLDDLLGLVREQ